MDGRGAGAATSLEADAHPVPPPLRPAQTARLASLGHHLHCGVVAAQRWGSAVKQERGSQITSGSHQLSSFLFGVQGRCPTPSFDHLDK